MTESFLHYLWLHQQLHAEKLRTVDGETVEVLHPGLHNHHAGPDFFNARLRIGATQWVGNVEIHLHSSDWIRHGHQEDPAYSNCILHVVWKHDEPVCDIDGVVLSTLELHDKFDNLLAENYRTLLQQERFIPCEDRLTAVDDISRSLVLDRMMVERLEYRAGLMVRLLEATTWHWEEAFFHALARNFGFHVNSDPFERLARSVPYTALLRLRERLLSLEALLFGQAGFLNDPLKDDYACLLREEFLYLRHKMKLHALPSPGWRFLRLHPANFPTLRIAQLAMTLHVSFPVFQRCAEARSLPDLFDVFRHGVSTYWRSHLRPDIPTSDAPRMMGDDAIRLIVINTVVPFLFLRGKRTGDEKMCERAVSWLMQLPAEDNRIIRQWRNAGWQPVDAGQSQALLQLHEHYCSLKKCLTCSIGHKLVGERHTLAKAYGPHS
jgi:hypothetical protein